MDNYILAAMALLSGAFFPITSHAQAAASQDSIDSIYECARALEVGEAGNKTYDFGSKRAWDYFDKRLANSNATEALAKANITKLWEDYQAKNGQDELVAYAWATAKECDVALAYAEQDSMIAVAAEPPKALTARDLRYHLQQTGDYSIVADYIVGRYPYGKKLMEEIPEGNLLGELVVETGAKGVMKFSDDAVYAMANQYYWQYNPPATRIIFAEYQRRLRVRKYNENEGKRWAERAAQDRAQQAAKSYAPSSSGSRAVSRKGSCTTVTDHAGGGTKAICNQY